MGIWVKIGILFFFSENGQRRVLQLVEQNSIFIILFSPLTVTLLILLFISSYLNFILQRPTERMILQLSSESESDWLINYLQSLAPKYAQNTRKTYYFLLENYNRNLLYLKKMIHWFFFKFSDWSLKSQFRAIHDMMWDTLYLICLNY